MVPVAAGPGVELPAVRLEPPALEAPAAEPALPAEPGILTLGAETLTYISTGTELQSPLGTMQLSSNFAAFENYKGSMTLEFVDLVPKFPGYRIASEFL